MVSEIWHQKHRNKRGKKAGKRDIMKIKILCAWKDTIKKVKTGQWPVWRGGSPGCRASTPEKRSSPPFPLFSTKCVTRRQRPGFPASSSAATFWLELKPTNGCPLNWAFRLGAEPLVPGGGPLKLVCCLQEDHLQASPAKKAGAEQEEPLHTALLAAEPRAVGPLPKEQGLGHAQTHGSQVAGGFWKKHVSGELGKPYFIKLMGFIAEEQRHYCLSTLTPSLHVDANVWQERREGCHTGTGSISWAQSSSWALLQCSRTCSPFAQLGKQL